MKWTHRIIMLSTLLLIIGLGLVIYGFMHDSNQTAISAGYALMAIYTIAIFLSMINAFRLGCYKTVFALWIFAPFDIL
jgi:hypothetical protein